MEKHINMTVTVLEAGDELVCVDCGKTPSILIDHDYCPDCYHAKALSDIDATN